MWTFGPRKVRTEGEGKCSLTFTRANTCKVPAECTRVHGDHKIAESPSRTSSTISRKEKSNEHRRAASSGQFSSHSSAVDDIGETPTPSSFVQVDAPHGYPSARVAFDFSASSPYELSISGKCNFFLINMRHLMSTHGPCYVP